MSSAVIRLPTILGAPGARRTPTDGRLLRCSTKPMARHGWCSSPAGAGATRPSSIAGSPSSGSNGPRRARPGVVWLLDASTVRWPGGLPPGALYRGVTGLNAEETPILWFRAGDDDHGGRRGFTASGVLGAAGIKDAARVHVATRRLRRQIRLRMAVNPQMWGRSACLAGSADLGAEPGPQLTITAAGTLRPLESEAIRTWM
jgi:hypothetical protein